MLKTAGFSDCDDNGCTIRGVLQFGPLKVDCQRYLVELCGEQLPLTRIEFDLLEALLLRKGQVVTYRELAERVLHGQFASEAATLRVHVSHLRGKLRAARACVVTVRGRGLWFEPAALEASPTFCPESSKAAAC